MDLGTLVKLQTAADQAPMQYMGELTSALSDTIRNRNARSMEQDAMRFFSDGNVSMDKIQQFQQMYPGVPAVEVMKQAATIGTQVEAQAMKDMYNTVGSIIQENGGKLDPKAFSEAMLKFTPQQRQQFMKLTVANPNFLKQFSVTRSQEDETKRTVETDALGNVTKEIKGTPKETPESRDIEMTGPDGKTVGKFTKSESVIMGSKGWTLGKAQFAPKEPEIESGQHVTRKRINPKTKQEETSTGIFLPKTKTTQWNEDWSITGSAPKEDKSDRVFGTNLRKEFNNLPDMKEYNLVVPKINSMQAALEESKKTNNFIAVDQALITLFNKLTDPSSVVRESEYARAAENMPIYNTIKGKLSKLQSGGAGLTPDERESLVRMAQLMYKGYEDIRNRRMSEYRGYAKSAGIEDSFLTDSMGGIVKESGKKKPLSAY